MNQLIEQHLTDLRRGKNTQLPLADLLRQSVYSRLAGYEDVNDAERVSAAAAASSGKGIRPLVEYKSFRYQAASWKKVRRVAAKVEHHQGELFPRVGFIVTNLTLPSRELSCHRFRSNEVRLWLSLIAYNLGNLWRRLVKTGGRLVKHARYYWLLLAGGHLTRRVFAAILRRIWALPLPAG